MGMCRAGNLELTLNSCKARSPLAWRQQERSNVRAERRYLVAVCKFISSKRQYTQRYLWVCSSDGLNFALCLFSMWSSFTQFRDFTYRGRSLDVTYSHKLQLRDILGMGQNLTFPKISTHGFEPWIMKTCKVQAVLGCCTEQGQDAQHSARVLTLTSQNLLRATSVAVSL